LATGHELHRHSAIVAVSPTQETSSVDRGSDDSPLRLNQRSPTNIGHRSAAVPAQAGDPWWISITLDSRSTSL